MHKKPLPIGISDFKKLIEGGYAYVDKTLLVQEIMEQATEVALIPRMRRFGKTLNISMLRYFFEKSEQDPSLLFKDLNIWKNEKYRSLAGQFPVIFLSLKDVKHLSWEETFNSLCTLIALEFDRHRYLQEGDTLSAKEKIIFHKILFEEKGDPTLFERSLLHLSTWLHRFHKQRVILLIDEYDTPAHAAYLGGYYNILISFLRNWLSNGLKDNRSLERGVLTGILRIAKESIFSGLNNVSAYSIMNEGLRDKFGLLETEVQHLLEDSGLSHLAPEIRKWYDGYRIGSCVGIYNPWSVLKCIAEKGVLDSYWVNTSDNALMKQLITRGTEDLKADVEELLKNGVVEKTIEEGIVFSELYTNNLKNREFDKEGPQNFCLERATIAEWLRTLTNSPVDCLSGKQVNEVNWPEGGASENKNSEANPTLSKPDSSGCLCIEKNPDATWSLLLFSGYLIIDATPSYGTLCRLRIPNVEVAALYRSMILDWFKASIQEPKYRLLLNGLINGDVDTFSQLFQEFVLSSFSMFDSTQEEPEKVYHAFVLGMLIGLKDRYEVKSNRESGLGRYDVMLVPKNPSDLGIILEFKKVGRFEKTDLETAVISALKQIDDKHYVQELLDRSIKRILKLGLAFEGKKVLIRAKFHA